MDWLGESRNVQDSGQASGEEGQNQDSKYVEKLGRELVGELSRRTPGWPGLASAGWPANLPVCQFANLPICQFAKSCFNLICIWQVAHYPRPSFEKSLFHSFISFI